MFWKVSNLIALICGVSLAILPWVMLFNPELPWQLIASAAGTWVVLGTLAVSVRDGSPKRNKSNE